MQLQNISKRDLWRNIIDVLIGEVRLGSIAVEEGEKLGLVTVFQAK